MSAIQGLQTATIINNIDPTGQFRLQITLPAMGPDALWARLVNTGSRTKPKIGDEVIVGFINNDVRAPVVLGILYNGQTGAK